MKQLFETDYVVYNPNQKSALQFTDGEIVLFGDIHEAQANCSSNEIVIPCTELPIHLQEIILIQINKYL